MTLLTSRNVFSGEFVLDQTPEFLEPYVNAIREDIQRANTPPGFNK